MKFLINAVFEILSGKNSYNSYNYLIYFSNFLKMDCNLPNSVNKSEGELVIK